MPLSDCEPNAWYLVITCKRCRVRQPLHRDTSKGRSNLLRKYEWGCIACRYVATYASNEIERYHHVVEPPKKPRSKFDCSRSEVSSKHLVSTQVNLSANCATSNFLLQIESWSLELWPPAPGVNSIDCRVVALALESPNDQIPTLLCRRWSV